MSRYKPNMSNETEKLKWATRFLFSTSAHMAGSLCILDVCVYVCISVAMSKRCHLFHIYTRPSTESILCELCSCLRGKRQIVLMGVWPPTPWSHLGRAAFTKCVNDMRAVHDVTESFWHQQTWSARTECCMWLCSMTRHSQGTWGVLLFEPLTVNGSILADLTLSTDGAMTPTACHFGCA